MNRHVARKPGIKLEEPDEELDRLASHVVDAALEVHRFMGPGFLESVYESSLCSELIRRGVPFERQVSLPVSYKGDVVGYHRLDLIVDGRLVVELKAVEAIAPIHLVQVRSYLKAFGRRLGLLINFNVPLLLHTGVRRVIWTKERDTNRHGAREPGIMAPWPHGD